MAKVAECWIVAARWGTLRAVRGAGAVRIRPRPAVILSLLIFLLMAFAHAMCSAKQRVATRLLHVFAMPAALLAHVDDMQNGAELQRLLHQ